MTEQPEALRLADALDRYNAGVCSQAIYEDYSKAAAELRRLSAVEAQRDALLEALKDVLERLVDRHEQDEAAIAARAAIKAVEGETK